MITSPSPSPSLSYRFTALLCLSFLAVVCRADASNDRLPIAQFSKGSLENWEEKSFEGDTDYQFVSDEGAQVLKAKSEGAASGKFLKIDVDLEKYPYLNWRWKASNGPSNLKETEKPGDDYVARIYVVRSGGLWFWRTKALNYVWSSRSAPEKSWPNAFAPDNAKMIAVRSAKDPKGEWIQEKRNVLKDLQAWLGEDETEIHAVAIMTDTDNSGLSAEAFYGDIYFSKE